MGDESLDLLGPIDPPDDDGKPGGDVHRCADVQLPGGAEPFDGADARRPWAFSARSNSTRAK